jgi:ATP-dependent DNA helicase
MDLQAQDRCHRIGQTRAVIVYRLITANTVENQILERASAKRKLERLVMHSGKIRGALKYQIENEKMDFEELLSILKREDVESIHVESHQLLSDNELSRILDRSAETMSSKDIGKGFKVLENWSNPSLEALTDVH